MKEYQIGETFKYNDVTLIVEENPKCDKCHFNYVGSDCDEFLCGPLMRTDGKGVIAKLK